MELVQILYLVLVQIFHFVVEDEQCTFYKLRKTGKKVERKEEKRSDEWFEKQEMKKNITIALKYCESKKPLLLSNKLEFQEK